MAAVKTCIVIPACNEEGRLGVVLDAIRAQGIGADVIVVDDGSHDATRGEALARGATVLSHPFNLGYGSALHTGYLYARRHGYDRVVQMDADGQHDPVSIPDLLRALDAGADVVIGSRYRHPDPPATTLTRRLGSRFFAWIVTAWTGVPITDPTSGFQGLSRSALQEVAKDGFPEDYPDADVIIAHHLAGLRLAEVPVRMHPRLGGVSMHRGGRIAFYAYKMLLTLCLLRVRRRAPFRRGSEIPVPHAP